MYLGGKQKNQQRAESKPKFARFGEQNEAGLFFKELRALNVEGGKCSGVQVFGCSSRYESHRFRFLNPRRGFII